MKSMVAPLVILVTVLSVFCAVAHAEGPKATKAPENYIVFKPGAFFPQGDIKDQKTGFNGEVAYGRRFNQNLALELASGYIGTGDGTATGSVTSRTTGAVYPSRNKGELYAIPVTLAIKGIVPIQKGFEVYGIGGAGAYYVHAKQSVDWVVGSTARHAAPTDSAWAFGGFLGAGMTYDITPEWFLGVEGKYLWVSKIDLSDVDAGLRASGSVRVEGVQGLATIGFRF